MNDTSYNFMLWVLAAVAAVLVVGFGLVYFLLQHGAPAQQFGDDLGAASSTRHEITAAMRNGDYNTVLATNEIVQSSPTATADQKALAALNSLGAQYRLTGDITARLTDVETLKGIIVNPAVASSTRADALNVLAEEYSITGGDPSVFAAIYKDAPFSQYYVANDPDLSARKLAEWSYEIYPTSNAAISISRWYIRNYDAASSADKKTYIATAEDYLSKADQLTFNELKSDQTYLNSTRYLFFRYWRVLTISGLSVYVGKPYSDEYKGEYESFINFAQTQKNALAPQYMLYGRLFYAVRLARDTDTTDAKTQLDQLATDLNANADKTNAFVNYLKSEYKYRPNGTNWQNVNKMMKISPLFKDAVTKALAS